MSAATLQSPAILHAATFCDTCLAIFAKHWTRADEYWYHTVHGRHHNDLPRLQQSASQNCRICKAIWLECITGFGQEDWSSVEVSTSFRVVHQDMSIEDAIIQNCKMELQIEVSRTLGDEEIQRAMMFDLLPYDPAAHRDPSDVETTSRDFLLRWYRDCVENHEECRPIFDGSYLPSRLLDIGQPSSTALVRVVTIKNKDTVVDRILYDSAPSYATLSHCWGKTQPLQLLTQNIHQLEQGIPRETLPRIFSETAAVCWQLSVRYLWIDCLCIFQDSEEDWARESSLMGKIYSHAIINIGATGSVNCNGSLFNTMRESPSTGLITWGGVPESRYIVVENNIEWGKSFLQNPLLRRGWVMQERLLATRMIHFARSELIFECRTIAATESYPIQVPDALRSFHDRRNRFWRKDFIEDDGAWSVLVQDYSKCNLTFGKDKLVALSGLVSSLESKGLPRGRYWAGMWEADLPYCLLWTRAALDKNRWPTVRPHGYRAPSWSWASLDCPIWTEWASGTNALSLVSSWEVKEHSRTTISGLWSSYPFTICMAGPLARAKVVTKGFGVEALGRGVERVQGISYCISRLSNPRNLERNGGNDASSTEFTSFLDDTWNDVIFDDFDTVHLDHTIWCAPIYECEKWHQDTDDNTRLLGLLLDEVWHNTYRRIGAFSIGHQPDQEVLKQLPDYKYSII